MGCGHTLRGVYYSHMLAHTSSFSDLIEAGKKLDLGIKLGRMEGPTGKGEESSKKHQPQSVYYSAPPVPPPMASQSFVHHYAPAPTPPRPSVSRAPPPAQQNPTSQGPQAGGTQYRSRKQHTPLPAPLSHIYRQLLVGDQIRPISPGPNFDPSVQDQSKRCEYYQGDNCWRLRDEIQKRINSNRLTFNAVRPPNVQANPLLDHRPSSGPSINMITICTSGRDEDAQDNPHPFVLTTPPRNPRSNSPGTWPRRPHLSWISPLENRTRTTRSLGPMKEASGASSNSSVSWGRPPLKLGQCPSTPFPSKKVTEEEAEAFMKIIKASEYKVVEQMAKSPAHISLLALLLSSEPHWEALLRVLTAAQVLDIPNAFSLLLGRPWIHSAGTVPSSLHQRLKFIVEEKLITVKREEDYAIYKETAVPYISVGDDENLIFHSFETISVIRDYGEIGPSRADRMIGKAPPESKSPTLRFEPIRRAPRQVPEIEESLRRLEDHQITSVEPTKEINVGTEEEPRTLKIGTTLDPAQRARMIDFLREYQEVFAWSYADMPSLDPSIVEHFLPLDTEKFLPKRLQLRRQRASLLLRIKEKVVKQIDAGFLEVCNYSEWVANIVPVEKKDGRVRASPKDNFPLPHIDVLVDNTACHALFSFMDSFSGYNQSRMAEKDKLKTTFTTMWGTFCYRIMPFGLKNTGATYQRAMVTLFHDMMHKEVEVYVDDMIAKSKEGEDHLVNLKRLFDRLKEYKLWLNPAKCTFGARSGKLLGFVVSERGIKVDPDKVKAIKELPPPSTVREVRGFLGRLNYIARFIANLTDKCQPLFLLLRQNAAMEWDHECQNAFDTIKTYLIQPLVLVPLMPNRTLILYLTVNELEVFGDSMLTIFQTLGQWKTKDAKLVPYHEYLEELAKSFEKISFTYTPRAKNQFADALATLASMASISEGNVIEPLEIEVAKGLAHCNAIEAFEAKPWYEDIKNFLRTGQYPQFADRRDRKTLRRLAIHYFLSCEILYRRSFDSTLLRCIDEHKSRRLMEEVHGGNCGPHMNGLMLAKKIMRLGYYWSTMETDCVKHVRHYHRCQVYAGQIKAPPNELRPMTAQWPFSMWGMDVIGPINPKASNGHMFILVAIDYFTKWIKAITLASVTAKAVARFLRRDVIARYG
ncbi:hypothetical protein CRG98_004826, partial [Punica granatum]